jgi:hypothetical protein
LKKIIAILFLFPALVAQGTDTENVTIDSLDYYLSLQPDFDREKTLRIEQLNARIAQTGHHPSQRYFLYADLFEEYRSYIYDSAYVCAQQLLLLPHTLNGRR